MTVVNASTGEVVNTETVDEYLEGLAADIRSAYKRSTEALDQSFEAYFEIGHLLLAARRAIPTNRGFGAWFNEQQFGFGQTWAYTLRTGAEHESLTRAAFNTQVLNGKPPSFKKAVRDVRYTLNPQKAESKPPQPETKRNYETVAKRCEQIAALAVQGFTSEQIGEQIGVAGGYVRKLAREADIAIPADESTARSHKPNSTRIVNETCSALEGLCIGVGLVDVAELDPDLCGLWADSLTESLKQLRDLRDALKGQAE